MREDRYTNTVEDAAEFERRREDDRPDPGIVAWARLNRERFQQAERERAARHGVRRGPPDEGSRMTDEERQDEQNGAAGEGETPGDAAQGAADAAQGTADAASAAEEKGEPDEGPERADDEASEPEGDGDGDGAESKDG